MPRGVYYEFLEIVRKRAPGRGRRGAVSGGGARGIVAAFALGVFGVQMGTVFGVRNRRKRSALKHNALFTVTAGDTFRRQGVADTFV